MAGRGVPLAQARPLAGVTLGLMQRSPDRYGGRYATLHISVGISQERSKVGPWLRALSLGR